MATVRIVMVDDHSIFREGLRGLLETEPDFQVVGDAGNAADALRIVAERAPDVMLLDYAMPGASGLDVLRGLARLDTAVRPILLTAGADKQHIVEAIRLGVRGVLLKDAATSLLYKCIRCVMAGEYWFGHEHMPNLVDALRRVETPSSVPPAETLTRRELLIVSAVVEGATNRDMSKQFSLSEQTVKNHLSHIFDKIGVSNRLELALFAIHHKLLERLGKP